MTSHSKRTLSTIFLLFCIFFLYWYIYLGLILIALFVFKKYSEGVLLAVVADLLFGYKGGSILGFSYSTTLIVGSVFVLSLVVRDKLRFIYDHA